MAIRLINTAHPGSQPGREYIKHMKYKPADVQSTHEQNYERIQKNGGSFVEYVSHVIRVARFTRSRSRGNENEGEGTRC